MRGQGGQTDLIRRIEIRRLRWVRAADDGLTGGGPESRLTQPVGSQSNSPGQARARAAAVTGGERRREADVGAGVLQSPQERHQDDDVLPADSTASFRGDDDGARRRTASGGGGARPARPRGCCEAQEHAQNALGCSSPPRAAPGVLHDGRKATDGRSSGSGAARVSATAALGS
jgi:hypothetical protein